MKGPFHIDSMKNLLAILVTVFGLVGCFSAAETTTPNTVYDPDPKHLWNRLNETLFQRAAWDGKKYGLDDLDILYWADTTNLLSGSSYRNATAVLDEFINTHGEKLISDPVKRALLQRDLWQLFDWTTFHHERPNEVHRDFTKNFPTPTRELQWRLAVALRRVALTSNEIAALPNNYLPADARSLPDLPRHLFDTNGAWINLGISTYNSDIAPTHTHNFGSRSGFSVLVQVPENRDAAIGYLNTLRNFAFENPTWVYRTNKNGTSSVTEPKITLDLNRSIPQFPTNTEWVLVRRMCLIDSDGNIQLSPLIESIQVRRYLQIARTFEAPRFSKQTNIVQQFFEFQLDRRHPLSLRAVTDDETGFPFVIFMGQGMDPFEAELKDPSDNRKPMPSSKFKEQLLHSCFQCHSEPGIFSVLSYAGFFPEPGSRYPVDLTPIDPALTSRDAVLLKQTQYSWGLLKGLWDAQPN
jgi:hypothetical protein